MRELFPSRAPFIPHKCCASLLPSYAYLLTVRCAPIVVCDQATIALGCEPLLVCPRISSGLHSNHYCFTREWLLVCTTSPYRYTAATSHLSPSFPHQAHLFPAQSPRSSPAKSPIFPKRMKFFLPLVTLLLMGK